MKDNSQFSAFYPTIFYPEHEQTAIQSKMSGDLQKIVQSLSLSGSHQSESKTIVVQKNDDLNSVTALADQMRESLYDGFERTNANLESLASCLEWNMGLLHESISEQITLLQQIAKQQQTPVELQAKEYLTSGQEMAGILAENLQSNRFDTDQANHLFKAANLRLEKAMDLSPSNKLTYSILISQAELCLLSKHYDLAVELLSESITYAPKEENFDFIGYSYRLLGRVAFIDNDQASAVNYLGQAIKYSPNYAIAWYDLAQYLVGLNDSRYPPISYLRKAIKLDPRFLVMAELESNFDPIRGEVKQLVKTILKENADDLCRRTEELRKSHLAVCSAYSAQVEQIWSILCNKNFKNIERLAAELDAKVGKKLPVAVGYFDERMQNILSLPGRVRACTSLESLKDLSHEIDSFGNTCESLLQLLIQTEKFWKDLPNWTRIYIGVCIKNNEHDKWDVNARRGRPEGVLGDLFFGGKWQPDKDSQRKLNTIAWRLVLISEINKILPELESALAASYEQVEIDAQYVFIKNCYSRLNLDLKNWNEGNGAPLQLWEFTRDLNQQWHIIPVEPYSPVVYIISVFSGKNIDLADGNMDEGARIQMWESGSSDSNQLWRLVHQDDGSYAIQSTRSNLFLGLSEYNREKGAIVNLQHWSGELSQRWLIHNVQ